MSNSKFKSFRLHYRMEMGSAEEHQTYVISETEGIQNTIEFIVVDDGGREQVTVYHVSVGELDSFIKHSRAKCVLGEERIATISKMAWHVRFWRLWPRESPKTGELAVPTKELRQLKSKAEAMTPTPEVMATLGFVEPSKPE